jgi:hypothetical protein
MDAVGEGLKDGGDALVEELHLPRGDHGDARIDALQQSGAVGHGDRIRAAPSAGLNQRGHRLHNRPLQAARLPLQRGGRSCSTDIDLPSDRDDTRAYLVTMNV